MARFDARNANTVEQLLQPRAVRRKTWRILTAISALPDRNTFVRVQKEEALAQM